MTKEEKYIARLMFKTKIHELDKQSFEDFFVHIMQNVDADFKAVKPQGSYGDRKNDGFNDIAGEYYQVYGPEDVKLKEDEANDKLEEDFKGLVKYWKEKGFTINKYYFVVNDKYKGAYPTLHVKAKKLTTDYKIDCTICTAKNLEDKFLLLDEHQIIDVIGFLPNALEIESPNYDVMHEVIKHLLKIEVPSILEQIPDDINFDNKIVFNSLSRTISEYLNAGRRQNFAIKEYFELNSQFTKEELRNIFTGIYRKAVVEISDSPTKNDEIFQYILEIASPNKTKAIYDSVYVLMSYYFEYCDIFETPI
jgi:hypothetical protein